MISKKEKKKVSIAMWLLELSFSSNPFDKVRLRWLISGSKEPYLSPRCWIFSWGISSNIWSALLGCLQGVESEVTQKNGCVNWEQ